MKTQRTYSPLNLTLISVFIIALAGAVYLIITNPMDVDPPETQLEVLVNANVDAARDVTVSVQITDEQGAIVAEESVPFNTTTTIGTLGKGAYTIIVQFTITQTNQIIGIVESDLSVGSNTPGTTHREYTFSN